LPAIALFELRYDRARSDRRAESERLLAEFLAPGIAVLPFDAEDASHAGDIRAHLESKGTPIGPMTVSSQPRRAAGADGDGLGDVMDAAVTAIEQNDGGADGPWSLPEGWTWAALSDLGTWMGGGIQGECGLLDQRNRSVGFTERHESRGYR